MPSFLIPNRLDVGILPVGVEGIDGAASITEGLVDTQLLLGPQSTRRSLGRRPKLFTEVGGPSTAYGTLFNGSSQFLWATEPTVSTLPITLAAWAIPGTLAGTNGYILAQGDEVNFGAQAALRMVQGGSDDVGYAVSVTAGGTVAVPVGGAAVVGQPCLIVGTSESATSHRVYFNGLSVNHSTTNIGGTSGPWDNTTVGALRRNTNINFFNGRVLQWAIWNRALKDEEVFQLYTDPWRMYWVPGRRVYFDVGAPVAAAVRRLLLMGAG
jgi:hypothetical protein